MNAEHLIQRLKCPFLFSSLDHESLDLVLQCSDLAHQVRSFVGGDRCGNDSSADTTGTAQSGLAWDVDVGSVLVFAEEGQVEEDSQRSSVSGEDDDLGDSTVESLGCLVGTYVQGQYTSDCGSWGLSPFFS